MSQKVILLNGCPSSGKDTIANYVVKEYKYKTIAFKDKAYKDVIDYYNISEEKYMSLYNDRSTKDEPCDELNGLSPRKAMQHVVENIKKPEYGKDYLAKYTLNIILNDKNNNYIVSDLGLDEEEELVHSLLKESLYKIVYIERQNYTFENDTRSKRKHIDHIINNNKDENNLYKEVDNYFKTL